MKYKIEEVKNITEQTEINGKWVLARPTNYSSFKNRLKHAIRVLVGDYDVLEWFKQ